MLRRSGVVSRLLAVALLLAPVAIVSVGVAFAADRPWIALVAVGWVLAYAVLGVLTIVEAVGMARRGDADALGGSGRLVKYAGIPFFTASFVLVVALLGGLVLISSMFAAGVITAALAAVAAPVLTVATYLVMLPTSTYGIAAAILLRRQGRASTAFAVVTVLLHLLFVLDVVSTLVVAARAHPVAGGPARRIRWAAAVVALALIIPTGVAVAQVPLQVRRDQAQEQRTAAMAALPGVARVTGMTVELTPGVTVAQARTIAATAYTTQDSTSPSDGDRWTLSSGSARLLLKGIRAEDAVTDTLVLLGRTDLTDGLVLRVAADGLGGSGPVSASVELASERAVDDAAYATAVATIIRQLSHEDPKAATPVTAVQSDHWIVVGTRLRSIPTAERLEALSAVLSGDIAVDRVELQPSRSLVSLAVPDPSSFTDACRRGLAALRGSPGLDLSVVGTGRSNGASRTC